MGFKMTSIISVLKHMQDNKKGRGLVYPVNLNNCNNEEKPEIEAEHEWKEFERIHNVDRY